MTDRAVATRAPRWTIGPVLAEVRVDPHTHVIVARPDLPQDMARKLERRLLQLRMAGATTVAVDLSGHARVSGALLAALLRARRMLESRNGRLVVNASDAESARVLSAAGLETIEDRDLAEA